MSASVAPNGVSAQIVRHADARAEVCNTFRQWREAENKSVRQALPGFVLEYNSEKIVVSAETRKLIHKISEGNLPRWLRKFKRGDVEALVPRFDASRRGSAQIEKTAGMKDFIVSMIAHAPHVRSARIYEALRTRFGEAIGDRALVSSRQVSRFIADWRRENCSLFERIKNPDRWKGRRSIALGRNHANVTKINEVWEIDGTPVDVRCTDGRCHLNTIIDVRSRMMIANLSPTASAAATAALCSKAIAQLGVPRLIKSDWGKEYLNARIERAMIRLDIELRKVARPYSGELKGHIERNQQTILHTFLETLPGFAGHNVIEAQAIRSRHSFQARRGERRNMIALYNIELSSDELQKLIDSWLENVYAHRPHAGLLGVAPIEVFRDGEARGEVHRIEQRTLDLLLAEDGTAVIGKRGLRIKNNFFWSDELIPLAGQAVHYIHTQNAGRVIVNNDKEKFICIAECAELIGLDQQLVALIAKENEKRWMREQLDNIRKLKREQKPQGVWREVLENAEVRTTLSISKTANDGKVSALAYRTPAVDAIKKALQAIDTTDAATATQQHDPQALERADALLAEHNALRSSEFLSDDEFDAMWCAIRRGGRDLTERERAFLARGDQMPEIWAASWETLSEFETFRLLEKRVAQRRARELMLSDDELDALWIAVRRTHRALTEREQTFLAHFENTPEIWAASYEDTDEYRVMRRFERVASNERASANLQGDLADLLIAAEAGRR